MNRYLVSFRLALPDKLHGEVLHLVGRALRLNGFEPEGLKVQGLADDDGADFLHDSAVDRALGEG